MKPEGRESPSGAEMAGLGMALAAALLLPLLGGLALDGAFKTSPIGVLTGMLIGIAAAVAVAIVRMKRYL